MRSKGLGEQETASLRVLYLLNEGGGGEFLDAKTFPSLVFIIWVQGLLAQASSARPGELTCYFFFFEGNINHVPSSLTGQRLPNLNLLKLELGVDYLFKTNK